MNLTVSVIGDIDIYIGRLWNYFPVSGSNPFTQCVVSQFNEKALGRLYYSESSNINVQSERWKRMGMEISQLNLTCR